MAFVILGSRCSGSNPPPPPLLCKHKKPKPSPPRRAPVWRALRRPPSSTRNGSVPSPSRQAPGSEVNPADVVRGSRPLAAPARYGGGGLLLLGQARAAHQVAAGELVHGLRFEVGGEGFATGGASLGLAAPAVLCKGERRSGWVGEQGGGRVRAVPPPARPVLSGREQPGSRGRLCWEGAGSRPHWHRQAFN